MKLAVISFSGNVGKTTIARHLLAPRLPNARLVAVESVNAGEQDEHRIRGREFAELHEYLQMVDDVVVDIGASNVEELITFVRRYRGSHNEFDAFVVPTVPTIKQQRDTIATLAELSRLGVTADRVRLVFNMVDDGADLERVFQPVLGFARSSNVASVSLACRLGTNEIYALVNGTGANLRELAADTTDLKRMMAATSNGAERVALARRLAMQRLASGAVPELDACFAALQLTSLAPALQTGTEAAA